MSYNTMPTPNFDSKATNISLHTHGLQAPLSGAIWCDSAPLYTTKRRVKVPFVFHLFPMPRRPHNGSLSSFILRRFASEQYFISLYLFMMNWERLSSFWMGSGERRNKKQSERERESKGSQSNKSKEQQRISTSAKLFRQHFLINLVGSVVSNHPQSFLPLRLHRVQSQRPNLKHGNEEGTGERG